MSDDDQEPKHHLHEEYGAFYQIVANAPGGGFIRWPTFTCQCGEKFQKPTWAEAGAEFDEHLDDTNE